MARRSLGLALGMTLLLGLTACGNTTSDRMLSGAAIGGGTGLIGGAIFGAPLTGAVVGAGVGAAAGGLSDDRQIDLGRPLWQ